MSGIEIAGLAVGVLPIVVEILKSYRVTKDRLKTFTRYAQVIFDVQLRYQVAAANFSNNCQLLVQTVVHDAREVSEMIKDPKHGGWQDKSLEERFRNFLDRDFQLFQGVVLKIRDVLRETQSMLSQFDRDHSAQSQSQPSTIQRLHQAFNISRKENQYRQWLEDLDQWNTKLGNLREQRCKLKKRPNAASSCLIRKAAPRKYADIRIASQGLGESLHESWSCTNISHTGHQAKLSLEATAECGTVQLDMVIACRRRALASTKKPHIEPPIWLHVRSITTNESKPVQASQSASSANCLPTLLQTSMQCVKSAESKAAKKVMKRASEKRVCFDLGEPSASTADPKRPQASPLNRSRPFSDPNAQSYAMLNLKATKSVCCHLSKACSSVSTMDPCLGYLEKLEVSHTFKLIFYDASRNATTKATHHNNGREAFPIDTLLQGLDTLHKLTLAHRLATATLQFHSTTWLPRDWSLRDVAYFANTADEPEDDISKKLQSLHLSTQFPSDNSTALISPQQSCEDLKYMYGIRNLTLAKLGVALIEICFQKDIGSLNLDPTPHDVITARKILIERPHELVMLGKRYIDIVRKCIDCDFSCGDNLSDDDFQSAVFTDVVCALEDMIKHWKSFFGVK